MLMLGYVASFLALISLLVNSSVGCCGHCLPNPTAPVATPHTDSFCNADDGHCCHSCEGNPSEKHCSDENDELDSACCPHAPDSNCPCRPGRCIHATVSTGIAPQSASPDWVCCRSLTALSDLSKAVVSPRLARRDHDEESYSLSGSLFRALKQVWLI